MINPELAKTIFHFWRECSIKKHVEMLNLSENYSTYFIGQLLLRLEKKSVEEIENLKLTDLGITSQYIRMDGHLGVLSLGLGFRPTSLQSVEIVTNKCLEFSWSIDIRHESFKALFNDLIAYFLSMPHVWRKVVQHTSYVGKYVYYYNKMLAQLRDGTLNEENMKERIVGNIQNEIKHNGVTYVQIQNKSPWISTREGQLKIISELPIEIGRKRELLNLV